MRKLSFLSLLLAALACGLGCSQQTKDKAGEAATATGEAIQSAAEDTAENVKKAGEDMEKAVSNDDAPADAGEQ